MRILFSCPDVPGHFNPMATLAHTVRRRGHDCIFLCIEDAAAKVRNAGLEPMVYCREAYPPGELARRLAVLSQLEGAAAVQYTIELFTQNCRAALEDGPRAISEAGADALVLDSSMRGLNLVAMKMKKPFVHVSNALHFDLSGQTPLCIYEWPHEATPDAIARNREGVRMFAQVTAPMIKVQREYAAREGLPIDFLDPEAGLSRLAQITQTPREFDFPGDHHPAHFHYAGPFHDAGVRPKVDFPWERLTGEPLIYASMGTLQNGSERIFGIIVEAAQAPGQQLVLSVGGNVKPEAIGPVAASTIVLPSVPQLEILKRAELCITHAGLNTALESLAQGVPMVAIPVTNDQPGVAARLAYTGTGVVVPFQQLSVNTLKAAVDLVLSDQRYRENAQRLQRAIEETNGLERAADIIDRTLREVVRE